MRMKISNKTKNISNEQPLVIQYTYIENLPNIEEIKEYIFIHKKTLIVVEDLIVLNKSLKTLEFLRFLRDCTSFGIRIEWEATVGPSFPLEKIYHLYPPQSIIGVSKKTIREWSDSYQYGNLFYRQGPDFLTIKDKRDRTSALNFTVGNLILLKIIEKTEKLLDIKDLNQEEMAALKLLEEYQILIVHDSLSLFLPYRIKDWSNLV